MADVLGMRILLKVDSGPGRNFRDLLMRARFHGLFIYRRVPNATSVQQETNISFGPFKRVVCNNLNRIALACFNTRTTIKLGHGTFGSLCTAGIVRSRVTIAVMLLLRCFR